MRSIPNISIISPADVRETIKSIVAALSHSESVYIRLTGGSNNPIIYNEDYEFKIGKAIRLKEGKDLTIYTNGSMVSVALDVRSKLLKNNIEAEIINVHTVKPIDKETVKKSANNKRLLVSIEEHNCIGGLGSAISEVISNIDINSKLIYFGLQDSYTSSGDYKYMLERNGLTPELIVQKILKNIN